MSNFQQQRMKFLVDEAKQILKYLDENDGPGINNIDQILQHVYLSNYQNATNKQVLRQYRIKEILFINESKKTDETMKLYEELEINHNYLYAIDGNVKFTEFMELVEHAYDLIVKAITSKKNILIHCSAGISRSPTVVIYYVLKRYYLLNLKNVIAEIGILETKDEIKKEIPTIKINARKIVNPFKSYLINAIRLVKNRRVCIQPNSYFIQMLLSSEQALKQVFYKAVNEKLMKIGQNLDENDESEESEEDEVEETTKKYEDDSTVEIIDDDKKGKSKPEEDDINESIEIIEDDVIEKEKAKLIKKKEKEKEKPKKEQKKKEPKEKESKPEKEKEPKEKDPKESEETKEKESKEKEKESKEKEKESKEKEKESKEKEKESKEKEKESKEKESKEKEPKEKDTKESKDDNSDITNLLDDLNGEDLI